MPVKIGREANSLKIGLVAIKMEENNEAIHIINDGPIFNVYR